MLTKNFASMRNVGNMISCILGLCKLCMFALVGAQVSNTKEIIMQGMADFSPSDLKAILHSKHANLY